MAVRLPGSDALGGRPTPQSARGVVGYDGTAVGRAVEGLGRVVGQIGDDYDKEQDAQAVFAARRKLDEWERTAILDPENGAASKLGKDAFGLPASIPKDFDEFAGKVAGELTSKRQKQAFQQVAESRRAQITDWASKHALTQKKAFDEGQYRADIQAFADRAALFPDKAAVEVAMQRERTIGYMRSQGRSTEEIQAVVKDNESRIHLQVLGGMLANNDGERAQAYFAKNKSSMSADAIAHAERDMREVVARGKAQAFGDMVVEKGMTAAEALAEARQKFSGPEEVAAVNEVKARFAEREAIKAAEQKEATDEAWKVITNGGSRKGIKPELWNRLSGDEQRQINDYTEAKWRRAKADAEGKHKTDMPVYYGLRLMAAEDPAAFAKVDLMKSQPYLKDEDLRSLINIQGSINKGDLKAMESQKTVKRTIDLVKSEIAAAGIDMTPKEGTTKAKETAAFFGSITQALDQAMAVKGGPLTDDEARRIGRGLLREQVEQGSGVFGLFQTKKRGFEVAPEERGKFVATTYENIPPDIRAEIEADLYPKGLGKGMYGSTQAVDKARVERVYQRALDAGRIK